MSLCSSKDLCKRGRATTGGQKLVISCHMVVYDDRILSTAIVNSETMCVRWLSTKLGDCD